MNIIFKTSKSLSLFFWIDLFRKLIISFVFSLILLKIFLQSEYNNKKFITLYVFLFSIYVLQNLYESYTRYRYFIIEIQNINKGLLLLIKDVFSKKIKQLKLDSNVCIKVSTCIFPIPTAGYVVKKMKFYEGKRLVFTQYSGGWWNAKLMNEITVKINEVLKES